MATTIQVSENLSVNGKSINIDGWQCEVEFVSFDAAITDRDSKTEILEAMADILIARKILWKDSNGQYRYCDNDELLIDDVDWHE